MAIVIADNRRIERTTQPRGTPQVSAFNELSHQSLKMIPLHSNDLRVYDPDEYLKAFPPSSSAVERYHDSELYKYFSGN